MPDDLYAQLGLQRGASEKEIKAAARRAQKRAHPDLGGSDEEFHRIQKAVAVLTDPEARAYYDQTGKTPEGSRAQQNEAEAHALVAQTTKNLMETGSAERLNLPKTLEHHFMTAIETLRKQLALAESEAKAEIENVQGFLDRLTKTKDGPDTLRPILEGQINGVKAELETRRKLTERQMRVLSRALELVRGYDYRVDPDPYEAAMRAAYDAARNTSIWTPPGGIFSRRV